MIELWYPGTWMHKLCTVTSFAFLSVISCLLLFSEIFERSWGEMKMLKRGRPIGRKNGLYAFMHCSGNISSAFLNSRLIALGTLFISDYIPSLKIHANCSRKSNCHKFPLFSSRWVLEICVCLQRISLLKANCESCQSSFLWNHGSAKIKNKSVKQYGNLLT